MSAIDTYTKYNSHSAAPYIEGNVGYAKNGEKRPGRKYPGGLSSNTH